MKAWEKVYTIEQSDKVIQSDVMTYDSHKDLVYAYGEDGHNVNFARATRGGPADHTGLRQGGAAQSQDGRPQAHDSNTIQMIDKNTGIRPSAAKSIDPFARKKKPPKKPFKLPTMNIERRGFTGQ